MVLVTAKGHNKQPKGSALRNRPNEKTVMMLLINHYSQLVVHIKLLHKVVVHIPSLKQKLDHQIMIEEYTFKSCSIYDFIIPSIISILCKALKNRINSEECMTFALIHKVISCSIESIIY